MVLGKLLASGRTTTLDNSRARVWQAKCTIIRETKVHKAKTMV